MTQTQTTRSRPGFDGSPPAMHIARWWDLALGALLLVAAAVAAVGLPDGAALRLAVTLPVLAVVPGYLLVQALFVRPDGGRGRAFDVLLGVGLAVPLLALVALLTVFVPGAFRPTTIVVATTLAGIVLASVAWLRRGRAGGAPRDVATSPRPSRS